MSDTGYLEPTVTEESVTVAGSTDPSLLSFDTRDGGNSRDLTFLEKIATEQMDREDS